MPIPDSGSAQTTADNLQGQADTASNNATTARNQATDARTDANDAQTQADGARADADMEQQQADQAQYNADQAQQNYQDNPTPENEQAAIDAQREADNQQAEADAADQHARNEQFLADEADREATRKENAATSAETAAEEAQNEANSAQAYANQLANLEASERAQAAAAQRLLDAQNANVAGGGTYVDQAAQLEQMRQDAVAAAGHAETAAATQAGKNGVQLIGPLLTWKVKGDISEVVLGNKFKTVGSQFKAIVGWSNSIFLATKAEDILGGKYTVVQGSEAKTVIGAALTVILGCKWDLVIGSKNEKVVGAKLEAHAGAKTEIGKGDKLEKEPVYLFKFAKKYTDGVDEQWKSATEKDKVTNATWNIGQEDKDVAKLDEKIDDLVAEWKKARITVSGPIVKEVDEAEIKCGSLKLKASGTFKATRGSNELSLTGGHAQLKHGGKIAKCESGQATLNGSQFKAD